MCDWPLAPIRLTSHLTTRPYELPTLSNCRSIQFNLTCWCMWQKSAQVLLSRLGRFQCRVYMGAELCLHPPLMLEGCWYLPKRPIICEQPTRVRWLHITYMSPDPALMSSVVLHKPLQRSQLQFLSVTWANNIPVQVNAALGMSQQSTQQGPNQWFLSCGHFDGSLRGRGSNTRLRS